MKIENRLDGAAETLSAVGTASISVDYNSATGVLSLNGLDLATNYQTVLRSVRYANTSEAPTVSQSRVLSVVVSDGVAASPEATSTIGLTAQNDPPINGLPATLPQSTAEDTPLIFSAGNGNAITVSDPDAGTSPLLVTLTATGGTVTLNGISGLSISGDGTGTVTLSGTQAAINTALNGLRFTPAANTTTGGSLQIVTRDQGATGGGPTGTDDDTVAITITADNDPPTIGAITAKSTGEDTPIGPISFTVNDVETAADSLVVTGASSDQGLVPDGKIAIASTGGGGRTVTITPADDQSGTASITLTVTDGTKTAASTFALTVTPANDAPAHTVPATQTASEDTPLVFSAGNGNLVSVSDIDAGGGTIEVKLTAVNGTVSLNGISGLTVTNGTNGTQTVTVQGTLASINTALNGLTYTPTTNSTAGGSLQIVTNDLGATGIGPAGTATSTVSITVSAANDPPTISPVGAQLTNEDTASAPIAFTVGDQETAAGSLTVTGASSNQALVPSSGIAVSGADASRTVVITPAPNQSGIAEIALTVSDGAKTATSAFTLTVAAVNDGPVNTVPGAQSVNRGAVLVFSAGNNNLLSVADPDAGAIAVTLIATNGVLNLNGSAGLTLVNGTDGSASLTVAGSPAALNTALNGLRFTPTPGYVGAASVQITTDDQGASGTGGAAKDTDTVPITVLTFHAEATVSAIPDQVVDEDTPTPTIPFSVGSPEVPPSSLTVTATASNQNLLPSGAIQLGGTAAARTIRLVPAANQSGTSTIDVLVNDGTTTTRMTFGLTVRPVNDLPVVTNDSYTIGMSQTLAVPAGTGLLANDSDVEGAPLTAEIVSGPAHGTAFVQRDGSFEYRAMPSFHGTDSFSYRTSDGSAASSPATVTIQVRESRCYPAETVRVRSEVLDGKLVATVEAVPLDAQTNNRLIELRFGAFQNGRVTIAGQQIASGAVYPVPPSQPNPPNVVKVSFTVERVTAGQPTTIPLTVIDACGSWPTFVGAGAGAGF